MARVVGPLSDVPALVALGYLALWLKGRWFPTEIHATHKPLEGILGYEERPLVSVDYKDDPRSAIIDALSTMVVDGTSVNLTWYDNEIGYVHRMTELALFGAVFAVNSSVHSYLILAYSDADKVATNVGFYYMANAGGRLAGTLLSGALYKLAGITGCLWGTVVFALATGGISLLLPRGAPRALAAGTKLDGGD